MPPPAERRKSCVRHEKKVYLRPSSLLTPRAKEGRVDSGFFKSLFNLSKWTGNMMSFLYVNFLSVVLSERNVIIIYTPNQTHRQWLRPFNHFVTPKKLSFHFSHFLFLTHFTLSLCVGKSTESGEEEDVFLKQLWNVRKN